MKNIKAVLFDSGKVLNYPLTNHWFITPDFWSFVDKSKFDNINDKKISSAFNEANKYIYKQKLITTKNDEYRHFVRFYEIFSSSLPELDISADNVKHMAEDLVFNTKKYAFYEDAFAIIPKLKDKYKLGIVSDAWPSLLDVYEQNDMTVYFDSFVISSFLGTTKPDEKMYITALNELNVKPDEAVFIDDNLKNCKGAIDVGINAILLCRNKQDCIIEKIKSIGKKYIVINNLYQLDNLL